MPDCYTVQDSGLIHVVMLMLKKMVKDLSNVCLFELYGHSVHLTSLLKSLYMSLLIHRLV